MTSFFNASLPWGNDLSAHVRRRSQITAYLLEVSRLLFNDIRVRVRQRVTQMQRNQINGCGKLE
jgi:hypothetical protein